MYVRFNFPLPPSSNAFGEANVQPSPVLIYVYLLYATLAQYLSLVPHIVMLTV